MDGQQYRDTHSSDDLRDTARSLQNTGSSSSAPRPGIFIWQANVRSQDASSAAQLSEETRYVPVTGVDSEMQDRFWDDEGGSQDEAEDEGDQDESASSAGYDSEAYRDRSRTGSVDRVGIVVGELEPDGGDFIDGVLGCVYKYPIKLEHEYDADSGLILRFGEVVTLDDIRDRQRQDGRRPERPYEGFSVEDDWAYPPGGEGSLRGMPLQKSKSISIESRGELFQPHYENPSDIPLIRLGTREDRRCLATLLIIHDDPPDEDDPATHYESITEFRLPILVNSNECMVLADPGIIMRRCIFAKHRGEDEDSDGYEVELQFQCLPNTAPRSSGLLNFRHDLPVNVIRGISMRGRAFRSNSGPMARFHSVYSLELDRTDRIPPSEVIIEEVLPVRLAEWELFKELIEATMRGPDRESLTQILPVGEIIVRNDIVTRAGQGRNQGPPSDEATTPEAEEDEEEGGSEDDEVWQEVEADAEA